ncbi:MAG TPA: glycosyltransferase family 2 protein [Balneolaceae bacterium]|nr:glycosyltransferase family 2 protein [Balneolaceae bacterium]
MPPKISIIIPHYNMPAFLPRAVESVAFQDYENIELIIVDDGSDSEQLIVINEQLSVNRGVDVKFLRIDHAGKPVAVNRGFKEATGDYLIILDADDLLPANSISIRLKALEADDADLCLGSFLTMYRGRTKGYRGISKISGKKYYALSRALLTRVVSPFHQNAMMFSRQLLNRAGQMDPRMIRGQDKDFALRLLQKSHKTTFVDETVYFYNRYHRPRKVRLYNRFLGTKFLVVIACRYFKGFNRLIYLAWIAFIGSAKMVYDVFGVYKK